jgi:DNA polymerase I-like protein with 3'-5' exonuclease and polymerase domains
MVIVPTLAPAFLLRSNEEQRGQARFEQTVIADLQKAVRLSASKPTWDESVIWEQDATGRPWRLFPTQQEVHQFLLRLYTVLPKAMVAGGVAWEDFGLVVDVETTKDTPFDCTLICIGLGYEWEGVVDVINVPFTSQGGVSYWTQQGTWQPGHEPEVRYMLATVFRDEKLPKTFHNKEFDKAVLREEGLRVAGPERDSMVAHHVVDSELPHGLGYVTSLYTDSRYWKDDVKGGSGWLELPDITLRSYNLRDILSTMRIIPPLHALIRQYGLWSLYQEELETTRVMGRATRRGIYIDQTRRQQFADELQKQKDDALAELRQLAGGPMDPSKPAHLSYFLFDLLKLPVVKVTKTGRPATDREALMLLGLAASTDEQRRALKALASYRQAEKFLGTFIHGLVMGPDGALHVQWKHLTTSGRLNSSPNAQNWNKKVKRMFRARPGYKLVGVDLSQAELRYIAYQTGDPELLRMYREGINVHTVNATLLFSGRCPVAKDINAQTEAYLREACPRLLGVDYDTLPLFPKDAWKPIRTLAKNFVFGCLKHDTKVATLRGSVEISKIQPGEWVWCWDGEKYVPTRVKRAWSTGVQKVMRLTVRDGANKLKTLDLTPNHEVMLRDGSMRAAYLLQPGDRLMPFRRTSPIVVSVEWLDQPVDVWDLEVEHPASNFALADCGFFVSNSNYGAKAETLYSVLRSKRDPETNELLFPDIQLSEIEALLILWKKLHPAIPQWWDSTCRATSKRGYAACPISGRRRFFREGFKRNEMLNFPIQAGVASWMNRCMNLIQRTFDAETGSPNDLDDKGAVIIQQVHDALTAEVPEWYAQRAGQVMLEVLNQPFAIMGYSDVTLPAENYDVGTYLDEV